MNLTAPTWKGQTPSDFKIYRITLDGELYETESFSIESETGIISIRNTSSLEVGLYSLSISCKSGGNYYEFPDAVTVNMMKPVPEEIKVEPSEITINMSDVINGYFVPENYTAQIYSDSEAISITSYEISEVLPQDDDSKTEGIQRSNVTYDENVYHIYAIYLDINL